MHISKVSYGKSVEFQGYWQRVTIEVDLDKGDDANEARETAIAFVDETLKNNYPSFDEKGAIITPEKKGENDAILALKELEMNTEFDKLKIIIDTYDNKEDALIFLATTNFKYSIEAKEYCNLKPSKK
jgi:hypothetical protein